MNFILITYNAASNKKIDFWRLQLLLDPSNFWEKLPHCYSWLLPPLPYSRISTTFNLGNEVDTALYFIIYYWLNFIASVYFNHTVWFTLLNYSQTHLEALREIKRRTLAHVRFPKANPGDQLTHSCTWTSVGRGQFHPHCCLHKYHHQHDH